MQRTVVTLLRDKNVLICDLIQVNRAAISLTCAFGALFPLTQVNLIDIRITRNRYQPAVNPTLPSGCTDSF